LLSGDPDRRLTIVCAPAGCGKSTLVAQWLAQVETPSAWVTLEARENDPRIFFSLIVAAMRAIDPNLVVGTDRLLAAPGPLDVDAVVDRLIGELAASARPLVLVLDDYHSIEAPKIHQAVSAVLHRLPPMVRIVVIGRTEPPLRLDPLRAAGELLELGSRDLQFTQEEALQLLQRGHGLNLTPGDLGVLQSRTEGWAAGLNLVGVALREQPRERIQRFVEEYAGGAQVGDQHLWEEALRRQPDDVRSFLLRTSVLDRFTADLCDAVTEGEDGAATIARCDRDNLFLIPLDDGGEWYRFHHLFADVLRDRLTQTVTDDELDGLHDRAAQWLEEHDLPEDAIHHAIAGHSWDRAVRLLEAFCETLFEREHIPTLRGWLEGLPPDLLERSPRLAFWLAWALGRSGRWNEGARPLRIAEAAWTAADDRSGRGSLLLWDATRSVYDRENRRAIEYATRALDLLPEDRATERILAMMSLGIAHLNRGEPAMSEQTLAGVRAMLNTTGKTWLLPFATASLALVAAQKGDLTASAAQCRQVIEETGDPPAQMWVQPALLQLGEIYFERGRLEDALRSFERADGLAERTRAVHWRSRIWIGLARIAWARGEVGKAFDGIERAVDYANQSSNGQDERNARAWQARFWLASRQLVLARRWADSGDLHANMLPEYERQFEFLTYARFLLQEDRPDLALRILEALREQADGTGRDGDLVGILVLTALAHKADGNPADALRSLRRALVLGRPGAYLRVFVEEGEELVPLLRLEAASGERRDYARHLLTEIDEAALARPLDHSGTLGELSGREVEVLRLAAAGLANREIGERLFINETTAERHLGILLDKVQAANRTKAVDDARRLGLI
jgi:LuxR family maltose regulon positive regulatory protein